MQHFSRALMVGIALPLIGATFNADARTWGTRNIAPTITGTASSMAPVGALYNFKPVARDADGDPLGFSIANKPGWARFDTATGTLQGTPSIATMGVYNNIVISVSDRRRTTSLPAFSIRVLAGNASSSSAPSSSSSSSVSSSSPSSSSSSSAQSSASSSVSSASSASSSLSSVSSSSSASTATGISLPGGSSALPGAAIALGAPTARVFNGLRTILDKSARMPGHAVPGAAANRPAALVGDNLPHIPGVRVLARGDAVILYLPNVAGAADYRAYAVTNEVSFTSTGNGTQPRGAVVACAGFRQHSYQSEMNNGYHTRELLQAIELPGFINPGDYTIVVEATSTPCTFPGMYAHTDAQITMSNDGITNKYHKAAPGTYKYTGIPMAVFKSFDTMKKQYGNEIINGQGAAIDFTTRATAARIGAAVPANDANFPSDPVVIARSALAVRLPFFDESLNAPIFDVGPNSIFEDFAINTYVPPTAMTKNPDYAAFNNFSTNPVFSIPNEWAFWGRFMQAADATPGTANGTAWSTQSLLGTQVFTRHGRLYTTFGDYGQDVGGTLSFSSLRAPIVQMDDQKYIHSMFRINSEATHRRYWYWTLCGAATSGELFDSATQQYRVRPLFYETSFQPGGNNPTVPDGRTLASTSIGDDAVGVAKECLTIAQEARPEAAFRTDGSAQTSGELRAQIHPKNKSHGIIALGNASSDTSTSAPGFRFKVDANGTRVGPMIEPFDQLQPLVHYDVFVRRDRLVVFINGRQGFCVDLSDIPLSMSYAMIGYGDLLYHSSIEWQELADSAANKDPQMYQYQLNTPIATSRIWDVVAHADKIEVPSQFTTFNPALCKKPSKQTVIGYGS